MVEGICPCVPSIANPLNEDGFTLAKSQRAVTLLVVEEEEDEEEDEELPF